MLEAHLFDNRFNHQGAAIARTLVPFRELCLQVMLDIFIDLGQPRCVALNTLCEHSGLHVDTAERGEGFRRCGILAGRRLDVCGTALQ